jgi:hypothetical protein
MGYRGDGGGESIEETTGGNMGEVVAVGGRGVTAWGGDKLQGYLILAIPGGLPYFGYPWAHWPQSIFGRVTLFWLSLEGYLILAVPGLIGRELPYFGYLS